MIDLVDIGGGHNLERGTADAYKRMVDAARRDGIEAPSLEVISAYRDTETQQRLWNEALVKYGNESEARIHVAPPGNSDHEKGIAIDFNIGNLSMNRADAMRKHPAWLWLNEHAREYGFVPYEVEPWHWAHKGIVPTVSRVINGAKDGAKSAWDGLSVAAKIGIGIVTGITAKLVIDELEV